MTGRLWAIATVGEGAYTVWRRTGVPPSISSFSLSAGPPESGPSPEIDEVSFGRVAGGPSHRLRVAGRKYSRTRPKRAVRRALAAFLIRLQGDAILPVHLATVLGIPRPIDETLLEIMARIRFEGSDPGRMATAIKELASALSSRTGRGRDWNKILMPPGHSPFDPWAVDEHRMDLLIDLRTVQVEWILGGMGDLGTTVLATWKGKPDMASALLTKRRPTKSGDHPLIILPRRDHEVWLASLPPVVDLWPSEMYDLLGRVGSSSPLFDAPEVFDEWAERVGRMSRPG